VPGRVKTRLIGAEVGGRRLDAADACHLHAALLGDVAERLAAGAGRHFHLRVAWDLAPGEGMPPLPAELAELAGGDGVDAVRQRGDDLGQRMYAALEEAAGRSGVVGVVGSDHPTLDPAAVVAAFTALGDGGADVALGPSEDGGYHFLAVRRERLSPRLFDGVEWSSDRVLAQTRARCRRLALRVTDLPTIRDVDRGEDVGALALALAAAPFDLCPRTRRLLAGWGLLASPERHAAAAPREGSCAS
jgi:glycosyltransferase A (GT-A) superfamily protein (DUF2064 family)